jgi:hypothetical protein
MFGSAARQAEAFVGNSSFVPISLAGLYGSICKASFGLYSVQRYNCCSKPHYETRRAQRCQFGNIAFYGKSYPSYGIP